MTHSIYHDLAIKAPLAKVYKAITEPEDLINWWPLKYKGVPKENEACTFFINLFPF